MAIGLVLSRPLELNEIILFAALALAAVGYWRFVIPMARIRRDIARLASGEYLNDSAWAATIPFPKTAAELHRLSEKLRVLDEQAAAEELSLKEILSAMQEGILIVNTSRTVTLANKALERMFSLAKSPLGRNALEIFRRHELEIAIGSVLANGRAESLELIFDFPMPGGKVEARTFGIHLAPMGRSDDQPVASLLLVFQDVTAIRSLEATRREFVANVSHEFRTPLTVINGYVETLMDGAVEDPEMTAQSLKAMQRNVERLSLLLEDLLTISRMESKGRSLRFESVRLDELVGQVVENLKTANPAGAVVFQIDWADDARLAEVDPDRMEQVFWNLLGNAIRHAEIEPVRIAVSAQRDGDWIQIDVSDNGTGIPLEDQAHIFERFYRVHKHRARDAGGTGLGLSIVKNIILAHGGSIALESTPGAGATFSLRIPESQDGSVENSRNFSAPGVFPSKL